MTELLAAIVAWVVYSDNKFATVEGMHGDRKVTMGWQKVIGLIGQVEGCPTAETPNRV